MPLQISRLSHAFVLLSTLAYLLLMRFGSIVTAASGVVEHFKTPKPVGPVQLAGQLYSSSSGLVFKVIDANNATFALKTFAIDRADQAQSSAFRFVDFVTERETLSNLTSRMCHSVSEVELDCEQRYVQVLVGQDVQVYNGTTLLTNRDAHMKVGDSPLTLSVDFTHNMVFPYVKDQAPLPLYIAYNENLYSTLAGKFGVFASILPQLTTALRYLHSQHVAHLGIRADAVLCSGVFCEKAVLGEFGRSWNGEGDRPFAAYEVFQEAVQRDTVLNATEGVQELIKMGEMAAQNGSTSSEWDDTMAVDWFGLGGTLFFAVATQRPVAEEIQGNPGEAKIASFFYKNFKTDDLFNDSPSVPVAGHAMEVQAPPASAPNPVLDKIKEKVVDGLLLIDGLLQKERIHRINLDMLPIVGKTSASLAQIRSTPMVGKTCSEFVTAVRDIPTRTALPSFLGGVC